jgi:Fis family transcriptional regulator
MVPLSIQMIDKPMAANALSPSPNCLDTMKTCITSSPSLFEGKCMNSPSSELTRAVLHMLNDYFDTLDGADAHDIHNLIMNRVEKTLLEFILQRTEGNQTHAAKMLGINRNTLYSKIQRYQLNLSSSSLSSCEKKLIL